MKIGVYGGTFDPPHIGHIMASADAAEQLKIDQLIFIPTGTPPHKTLSKASATGEDRLEMTRLAVKDLPFAVVSDAEVKREGKSYTIDTLRAIKNEYPNDELVLFMGTDMFLILEEWKDYAELIKNSALAVFCRADGDETAISGFAQHLKEKYNAKITLVKNAAIEISSSELRKMLPARGGLEYLNNDVYSYIIRKRLYNAKPTFDWLRFQAYNMLPQKRIMHVAGCEAEAVRFAARWGCSQEAAREAAILHDVTKNLTLEDQLMLCEKYDIILDNVEKTEVKLLHSRTGAAIAKDVFGVSAEVCSAIDCHTTGKKDMSQLDKVIYLADYIEPSRDFDGLDKLRALSYENIDAAMLMALRMSIEDMNERGISPHERTVAAIEFLSKSGENNNPKDYYDKGKV